MARTIGELAAEARLLLNDSVPISGTSRFADADLTAALNEALLQTRAKRPDAWLGFGLRKDVPKFALPADANTALPIDGMFYSPLLFYVVGRSEMVEDTFSDSGRAITLMNKFVSQLLKVAS